MRLISLLIHRTVQHSVVYVRPDTVAHPSPLCKSSPPAHQAPYISSSHYRVCVCMWCNRVSHVYWHSSPLHLINPVPSHQSELPVDHQHDPRTHYRNVITVEMHYINYKCICLVPVLLSGSLTAAWILRDATITKEIEVYTVAKKWFWIWRGSWTWKLSSKYVNAE